MEKDNISDEELMILIGRGDKAAYEEITNRHLSGFYKLAYGVVINKQDAEEVIQNSFLKLWQTSPNWKTGKAKFTTWFYRIVKNEAIDLVRKRKENVEYDDNLTKEFEEENFIEEDIKIAIDRLPKKQKAAILLYYFQDLSQKQAAENMGISIKALESLLLRGKRKLKEIMEEI